MLIPGGGKIWRSRHFQILLMGIVTDINSGNYHWYWFTFLSSLLFFPHHSCRHICDLSNYVCGSLSALVLSLWASFTGFVLPLTTAIPFHGLTLGHAIPNIGITFKVSTSSILLFEKHPILWLLPYLTPSCIHKTHLFSRNDFLHNFTSSSSNWEPMAPGYYLSFTYTLKYLAYLSYSSGKGLAWVNPILYLFCACIPVTPCD